MNKYIVSMVISVITLAGTYSANASGSSTARELFTNPPAEYSSAPFWVWNDMMTDEMVVSTLHNLASQGIRQVFIHPRPGLMTPYLSQEWFRLWKVALKEAKRLGMNIWIYDENSYPSGFAGGLVPKVMKNSEGMGLNIREEKEIPKWSGDIVAVYQRLGDGYENISEKVKTGQIAGQTKCLVARVVKAAPGGMFANGTYVNLLTKGVTDKFLEVTLDAYKREFGEQFGKRIPGVFTDEPHVLPAGMLPWAEDLPEVFEKRWGYSLIDNLPSLVEAKGNFKQVRHNYFAVLLEMFVDRWGKPYYQYCEKNNLEFTGHYWEHEWPNCTRVPDNMAMYAWHQRPAIDILFNQYSEHVHSQFGNIRSVKELASVANQLGRRRTLCEAYGGAGWELRFEDMKRIGDWLMVLGVNTMTEHLSFASIRGVRKADYPQSFSYHEPWWEAYHVMVGYFARLSAAMSQGEQVNKILVLEPTTTAWVYQFGAEQKNHLEKIGSRFQNLIVSLTKQQVEFDIGCEDIISRYGSVEAATLKVGQRKYDVIVFPEMFENINSRTMELIEAYASAGGEIFCCGEAPSLVNGQKSTRGAELAKKAAFKKVETNELAGLLLERTKDNFAIKDISGGILLHHRRKLDDGELLFLTNTAINSPCRGVIESDARGVENWDAETGTISAYAFSRTAKGISAEFELEPCGSMLLFLSKQAIEPAGPQSAKETKIEPIGPMKIKRTGFNVLTVDFVDIAVGKKKVENIHFSKAAELAFRENGFNNNPWDHAVQFDDELISRKFADDSGFEVAYRFTIQNTPPKPLYVVIERPDIYTISCNGKELKAEQDSWWLDKSFGKINISSAAKKGENKVTIKARPFTVYHEIAAAYILGDFKLEPADSGFMIVPDTAMGLGQWNKHGYPFYGEGVSYCTFQKLIC
ncbi:MAG: glycosyl hydrolase [Planctomycetota bacterium]